VDVGDRVDRRGRAQTQTNAGSADSGGVTIAPDARRDTRWTTAVSIVSAAAVIRLAFAALLPVFPDEAYYWEWSRRLAPAYFDHPPMVALLIRFGTSILGATPVGIRLGSIVAGWIASLFTVMMAWRVAGGDATIAVRAAVIMSVLPLAAAGLVLATPDAPLLAATAATLYCVLRAVEVGNDSRTSMRWWVAAGVALGVAFLSKYTAVVVPLGVLIAFTTRPSLRWRLKDYGPYVACMIAALVFLPVVVWNARHDWVSFAFQLKHGLSTPQGSVLVAAWKHEGDLFGGQAALVSPILFVLMGIVVWRSLDQTATDLERVLGVVALVCFAFFVVSAVRQRVEPNWPATAYVPAIVLLARWLRTRRREVWIRAGVALAGLMSLAIYVQGLTPILPIPPARDPVARAFGWSDLARAADSTASAVHAATNAPVWIGADRYQEAAELSLNSPAHATTFATNLSGRANQYDLWPRFPAVARVGDALVLVVDESDEPHAAVVRLTPYFASIERGPLVVLRRDSGEIGRRRLWTLVGWRGDWPVVSAAH
jgi:4-amino-4-deoxy-L-arabinose transferase-like glycosyltransferase